jgi:flagellar hook-associated protein 1 FlgK
MPSTFFAYNIANSGLQSNTVALDVISNNITNVDTPGYTRETATITSAQPLVTTIPEGQTGAAQLGTGVNVSGITRTRNSYIDQQVWAANGTQGAVSNISSILNEVQTAYGEPSTTGISAQLTTFFNSFSSLAANPQSGTLRSTVLNAGQALSSAFNAVSSSLTQLAPQISSSVTSTLTNINTIAGQIANLNNQIGVSVASGSQPNTLEDQRGALLDQLSSLVNIQVVNVPNPQTGQPSGVVNVNVGGYPLVQSNIASPLPTTTTIANGAPGLVTAKGDTIPLSGGELYGLLKASSLLSGYQSSLDTLATSVINTVNGISATGAGSDGSTGNLFFSPPPASGTGAAATMSVSPTVANNVNKIAAATAPVPPNTFDPGNGDNASTLAALTTTPVLNGTSLDSYFNASVANIGADAQTYLNQTNSQQNVVTQLQNLQSTVSGVNMDEELTNMLEYQRSYQAAARVMNTADDMLMDIINGLGSGATALA